MNSFKAAAFIGLLGILILVSGYISQHGLVLDYIISDFYANFGEGFLGIGITVLVIDYLNMRRDEVDLKKQLIRDFGSTNNMFAQRAIRELRANGKGKGGWLTDGTLHGAILLGADLTECSLESSSLCDVDLTGAVLSRAFLADAKLKNAKLRFANLTEANLEDAKLTGADLSGACLRGSIICGADLSDADLSDAILDNIKFDNKTIWPENFTLP